MDIFGLDIVPCGTSITLLLIRLGSQAYTSPGLVGGIIITNKNISFCHTHYQYCYYYIDIEY